MTTAYITHADCLRHEMGPGHPESPDRLSAVNEQMRSSGLLDGLLCLDAPLATADDLKRVHSSSYVDLIFEHAPVEGYVQLDPDTAMNSHSLDAARRAAGAGLLAIDELVAGRARNAFCAVRPCGHHATHERSMGFCIFNNIGVAAAYALEKMGFERVAVIDFDVHHGNGTEDIFSAPQWQERILMAGFFQHPFYPYSGTDSPAPNMINVPLAAGSGGGLQAGPDTDLRRLRCAPRRFAGRPRVDRSRLCMDYPQDDGGSCAAFAAAHRLNARGGLQSVGARQKRSRAREDLS
jgi:acetoin utilization deacetylase AcuC-like enzyme